MIQPPFLKPGDKIALVTTARCMGRAELQPAMDEIIRQGFVPVPAGHLPETADVFYQPDAVRASGLQQALDDPSVKAVIVARGGYGSLRIVDDIDWTAFRAQPKWLAGFSDITVFHAHIPLHTGVCTLHSTMPVNFSLDQAAVDSLFAVLRGAPIVYHFSAAGAHAPRPVQAPVSGGNLSLLYALQGSASAPDTEGTVLFIEDLDEYLYQADRMLVSLKRSGRLSNLAALLVGGFTDMKDNAIPFGKNIRELVLDAVGAYGYPVFFNFPAGHQPLNHAFKIGAMCSIGPEGETLVFRQ